MSAIRSLLYFLSEDVANQWQYLFQLLNVNRYRIFDGRSSLKHDCSNFEKWLVTTNALLSRNVIKDFDVYIHENYYK